MGQRVTIEFHNNIGRDKIEDRCRELSDYLRLQLVEIPELTILTPDDPGLSCGIVTCSLNKGKNSSLVARMRDEHGIILKSAQGTYAYSTEDGLDRENYNAIRFSTHIFNNKAEIDHVTSTLRGMIAE